MAQPEYLTLDGTRYSTEKLSDEARNQMINIQAVDAEMARLQQQLAIAQTARNAYVIALRTAVKMSAESTEQVKPKKPRASRKPKSSE
ncbi:DUF6447 family protein [Stutzerimonas zhaodongensis]|jgi:hypothetical protein|uniref:DUF6447 family protein n=1 Tax=Stutzerimonas zhaodongensis TaxID=1176257 RepID=UPI001F4D9976|nr:DUF6447 family protein [Stutzerimonas zhaodongensis]UNG18171.1 DUF6447 family protein [Stutzerimonas zhaodongensis]